jgi:hypothetical protein
LAGKLLSPGLPKVEFLEVCGPRFLANTPLHLLFRPP